MPIRWFDHTALQTGLARILTRELRQWVIHFKTEFAVNIPFLLHTLRLRSTAIIIKLLQIVGLVTLYVNR